MYFSTILALPHNPHLGLVGTPQMGTTRMEKGRVSLDEAGPRRLERGVGAIGGA